MHVRTLHRQDSIQTIRSASIVAAAASAVAAGLYYLIGLGVISVGESAGGGTPDLFAFGAILGTVFTVTAVALLRFRSPILWAAVAGLQVVVIVGYFAVANVRTPSFEVWGLMTKLSQAIVFGAASYLLAHRRLVG
jgi:hypothetical protein